VVAIRNITIVSAVYPPEPQASARMSHDLADHLADLGHCVTVLCPQPSRPQCADYGRFKDPDEPVVRHEGKVKVIRLPSFAAPLSRMLPRMWESFSFGREVVRYLSHQPGKPDALYVNAWPLFAQSLVARFSTKNAIPLVLQIMDIYPEALTNKLPGWLRLVCHAPLRRLDVSIAQSAAAVVVISENMRLIYLENRRIPVQRVVAIPTWQDDSVFIDTPCRSELCRRFGVDPDLFTFLFLGNIGPVAGVDFLITAFAKANIPRAQLLIIGDGAAKSSCVALAEGLNLSDVYFISDPEATNVPLLQGMAHVCMLPMVRGSGLGSIPSKLPSYLFSGKPVIATVDLDSDTALSVRRAECGWVGPAEDATWLADTMRQAAQQPPGQLEALGQRGRDFGLTHFSKSLGLARLADAIIKACSQPTGRNT
jgi:glycosyltransferase involved in cell wall biosynthesis